LQEEEAEALDEGGEHGCCIKTPSPCRVLADEAACDGSDGGAQKWC
jgi:hypothetical protein